MECHESSGTATIAAAAGSVVAHGGLEVSVAAPAIRKTVVAIVISIAGLAFLAWLDEREEGRAALEDFAQEQAVSADQLASRLARELAGVKKDAILIGESER